MRPYLQALTWDMRVGVQQGGGLLHFASLRTSCDLLVIYSSVEVNLV